jgi:hypothetical protein
LINIFCEHSLPIAFMNGGDPNDPATVEKSIVDLHQSQVCDETLIRQSDKSGLAALPQMDIRPIVASKPLGVKAATTGQDDLPVP